MGRWKTHLSCVPAGTPFVIGMIVPVVLAHFVRFTTG